METLALLLAGFIGFIFIFAFLPGFLKSTRSKNWIKLPAKIKDRGIDTTESLEGGAKQYSFWIMYEYIYRNTNCKSNRVYFATPSICRNDKTELKNHFRKPCKTPS